MTDAIVPGRLLLIAAGARAHERIDKVLRARAGASEVRAMSAGTFVVYADAECATVRDWIAPALMSTETALVVEFESWSGSGDSDAIDAEWLMRRGH